MASPRSMQQNNAEGEIRTPEGLPPVALEATALSGLGYLGPPETIGLVRYESLLQAKNCTGADSSEG